MESPWDLHRPVPRDVFVALAVIVAAPVIVAVHVNGNGAVALIDPAWTVRGPERVASGNMGGTGGTRCWEDRWSERA